MVIISSEAEDSERAQRAAALKWCLSAESTLPAGATQTLHCCRNQKCVLSMETRQVKRYVTFICPLCEPRESTEADHLQPQLCLL